MQPSLLRLLHGATSLLVAGAWLSGLVLLLTLDRRWGSLPLDLPGEWVDGRRLGLREGQFDHLVYDVHLSAWLLLAISVVVHLAGGLGRGGWPLLRSMAATDWRPNDAPGAWWGQLSRGIRAR